MKSQINSFHKTLDIDVVTSLNPSECISKVKQAVEGVLNNVTASLSCDPNTISAKSSDIDSLTIIYRQIRDRQTLGVLRRLLIKNVSENSTWIYLNKQAAYMKQICICDGEDESPLGPIKLTFTCGNLQDFIDWLAPV